MGNYKSANKEEKSQRTISAVQMPPATKTAALKAFKRHDKTVNQTRDKITTNEDKRFEETLRVANMVDKNNMDGEWVVDSGCTEHITHLSDLLENEKNVL